MAIPGGGYKQPNRWFWLMWLLATIVALAITLVIMGAGLGALVDNAPEVLFGAVLGGVLGITSGITQWLILRRYLDRIGAWVPLTILGWVLFWAVNLSGLLGEGSGVTGKIVEGLAHGAIFGALLGVLQWLILRRGADNAGWWILVSAAAWSVGAALGDGVTAALGGEGPFDILIGIMAAAILTGVGMMWLLRQSARAETAGK